MAEESKKINWAKIGLGFGVTFVACLAAFVVGSVIEEHVMGGKKVKPMAHGHGGATPPAVPPSAPATPAKAA